MRGGGIVPHTRRFSVSPGTLARARREHRDRPPKVKGWRLGCLESAALYYRPSPVASATHCPGTPLCIPLDAP